MTRPDGDADIRACERLVLRYAQLLDLDDAGSLADLYTEDGTWHLGDRRIEGREAIRDALSQRATSAVTARHLCTTVLVDLDGPDQARGISYGLIFRDPEGRQPSPSTTPVALGEWHDTFARVDGSWRIRSRSWKVIFAAQSLGLSKS